MTQAFTAQVRNWTEKATRNTGLVIGDAIQGVFADMSRRQPSVKETGGTFEVGKVPEDEGILINSLFGTLNGSGTGQGETAYIAALSGFEAGDVVGLSFSAEYAPSIEYGTSDFPGRFMVREANNGGGGWQGRIDASAAKFKD